MRKLNVTDRQTDGQTDRQMDGGALQYLPSRAFGAAGDNKTVEIHNYHQNTETRLDIHIDKRFVYFKYCII